MKKILMALALLISMDSYAGTRAPFLMIDFDGFEKITVKTKRPWNILLHTNVCYSGTYEDVQAIVEKMVSNHYPGAYKFAGIKEDQFKKDAIVVYVYESRTLSNLEVPMDKCRF